MSTIVWLIPLLIVVAVFVTQPFWRNRQVTDTEDPELAALEAAREAKYREIRDAEVDRESGKLSQEDFERLNADLKREAVDILDQLEAFKDKES